VFKIDSNRFSKEDKGSNRPSFQPKELYWVRNLPYPIPAKRIYYGMYGKSKRAGFDLMKKEAFETGSFY